ncbi:MAG: hypothetical protein ACOZB3_11550 [Calditrichota bacterium]
MRISEQQRHNSFIQNIQQRLVNMNRIQEELGTGRSLFTPSENIRKAGTALSTEDAIAAEAQYMRNIENGQVWVAGADSKLQAIIDLISEVDSLALAADNSSQNADDRSNTAVQLDQKMEELLQLVNGQSGDRYLFGGHGTTAAPFTAVRDENGKIIGATANEDTIAGRIYRRIGRDEDIQINVSGSQLFQPVGETGTDSDLFYVVSTLRNTIANNNTPPEGFEETRSNNHLREQLADIRDRITEQQSYLGSIGQRLESSMARLKEREIQLTDTLEQAQGVDLTDLVSRSAVEEGAYNALAAMGTQLLQKSLIDYLR